MPTKFTITLDTAQAPSRIVTTSHTHAFACELLERSLGSDHRQQTKAFAVGPLADDGHGATRLELNWLDDRRNVADHVQAVRHVRLGTFVGTVRRCDTDRVTYEQVFAVEPVDSWTWTFTTPTYLDLNGGRRYPLPDPQRMLGSLASRWSRLQPAGLQLEIAAADLHDLLNAVVVSDADIRTETLPVSLPGGRIEHRAGFTGTVTLGLLKNRTGKPDRALSVLSHFAQFAGVGAQTTHGFGAVSVAVAGGRASR